MKVAAIDIGSNSIHLVVTRIHGPGMREVLDRDKEMLQLGRTAFKKGIIPSDRMDEAMTVLKRYRTRAEGLGTEAVLAVATSAVRDARNRAVFLERADHEARLAVRILTGEEEAKLIYLGARDFVAPSINRLAVIDIGGGSLEVALGVGRDVRKAWSLKLGVLRLALKYPGRGRRDREKIEKEIRREIRPLATEVAKFRPDCVVGTSGTILAVAKLLGVREDARPIRVEGLETLIDRLNELSQKELKEMVEVGKGRARTITPGALLLKVFMEEARIGELIPSERALRDGVVTAYAQENASRLSAHDEENQDPRRRSVYFVARRLGALDLHAQQTARLALQLFDGLAPMHDLDTTDRELLEYAALLHDAGYWISSTRHNKHASYLIRQSPLEGFTRDEINLMALVARYHRGTLPKGKHADFGNLKKKARKRVRLLASMLRIADALDRSHSGLVRSLEVRPNGKTVTLDLESRGDLHLELYAAERRSDLFQRMFERDLRFEVHHRGDS